MKHISIKSAMLLSFVLSGCANFTSPIARPLLAAGYPNTSGSHQFFDEGQFEQIDLVATLDPDKRRFTHLPPDPVTAVSTTDTGKIENARIELERAFRAFYTYGPIIEERRSRVQDRVLAASEQRCNTYKNYLKRIETAQGGTTGILTTVFGGAGAIATHVKTVRALAGLAGISSGVGAELQQEVFSNVASQVIVPGIDLARLDLRKEMLQKRTQPIAFYTVEAALVDTARYHGACSMNAGLERAGKAVNEISNPGLRALNATLGQLNLAQKLAKRMNDETVVITETDLRIADGFTVAGLGAKGSSSALGFADVADTRYLDRYLLSIREAGDSLSALKNLVAVKIEDNRAAGAKNNNFEAEVASGNCTAAQLSNLEELCKANVQLKKLLSETDPAPTFKTMASTLAGMPTANARETLAKKDAEMKVLEAKLHEAAGTNNELKARHSLRDKRLQYAKDFIPSELVFETIAMSVITARKAIAANGASEVGKAIAEINTQIGELAKQ